jgi:nuclear pore complex protein Nup160
MSLYTPFQLVHAHLPALPTAPGTVAEVSVPSERSFADPDAYVSPLHPDHAVSAAFDSRTATVARTVYNGYALELRSLSPMVNQNRSIEDPSIIRILFPDQLRPLADGCIIPSFGAGQLVVVVLSTENVVYRLTFPIGMFVDKGDRITLSPKADWVEEWDIDPDLVAAVGEVGSWSVTDENTVVLGCADGGIIRVVRASNSTPGE